MNSLISKSFDKLGPNGIGQFTVGAPHLQAIENEISNSLPTENIKQ
jgi:hypothetical protein